MAKKVSEVFSAEDQPKAVCIGLFLVMMGGCVSAVAFDSHPWYPVMLAGLVNSRLNSPFCNWVLPAQWCMGFSCIGVIVLDVSDYTMASLAYSLGVGMSSSMVAVRKAYAGSYSKLLALQKVAEVCFNNCQTTLKLGSFNAGTSSNIDSYSGRIDQHVGVGWTLHCRCCHLRNRTQTRNQTVFRN